MVLKREKKTEKREIGKKVMSSRQIHQNKSEPSEVSNILDNLSIFPHTEHHPRNKKNLQKFDFFFFCFPSSGCDDRRELTDSYSVLN